MVLSLIRNYLSNKKRYVEVENEKSEIHDSSIGVSQGSMLGPLLFIIYIIDFAKASEQIIFCTVRYS